MRRAETVITLSEQEREQSEAAVRMRPPSQRDVQRARLALPAAEGMANTAIAREVGLSRARVVVWRQRFARERLAGLHDSPRSGAPRQYDETTERRIYAGRC
jgi:transposase